MKWLLDNLLLNPMVLLVFGVTLGGIGAFALADVPSDLRHASVVEQLAPVGAVTGAGQPAFVEGRVSGRTPPAYREFVAYLREEYRSCGRNSCWVEVGRATPPLLIEAPGGALRRVVNDDYELGETDTTVEESAPTFAQGAVRTRGLVAGGSVLAVGQAAAGEIDGAGGLVADTIYVGTRSEYVARVRRRARTTLPWGGAFLLVGLGLLAGAGWRLRSFLRETPSATATGAASPPPRGDKQKRRSKRPRRGGAA